MADLSSLTSYTEFLGGFIAVFSGVESFRVEFLEFFTPRGIKEKTKGIMESIKLMNPDAYLKLRQNSPKFEEDIKDLERMMKIYYRESDYLDKIQEPMKILFLFTFLYCLLFLLFVGVESYISSNDVKSYMLIFMQCIAFANLLCSVHMFMSLDVSDPPVDLYTRKGYLIIVLVLYIIFCSLYFFKISTYRQNQFLMVAIYTPLSPFITQILLVFAARYNPKGTYSEIYEKKIPELQDKIIWYLDSYNKQ